MMTLSGVRKMWLVVPLLALAAAWALPSAEAEVVPAAAVVVPADVTADAPADADEMAFAASNCTYYNNASHSMIVGQFGYDCCNNRVAWGRKTQFYQCGGCFPCYPPPPW